MEEIERSHALFTAVPYQGFCHLEPWGIHPSIGQGAIYEKNGNATLMFPKASFHAVGKAVLEKVLQEPDWADALNAEIRNNNRVFFDETENALKTDWSRRDSSELAERYAHLHRLQVAAHTPGLPWIVLEFDHALLTNYLLDYLKGQIKKRNLKTSAGQAFSTLTTPTEDSFAQREEQSMLTIAAQIHDARVRKLFESENIEQIGQRLEKMLPDVARQLDAHHRAFCWLPYMYEGPAWKKKYFIQVLKGLLRQDVAGLLETRKNRHTQVRTEQARLLQQLEIDPRHRRLLQVANEIVFTKAYRKDCLYHFFYGLEPLLKEAAKRLGLTLRQIRRCTPEELIQSLKTGHADADELNRRWEGHVFFVQGQNVKILTGNQADRFMQALAVEKHDPAHDVRQLSGDCACPGYAKGVVRRVERPEDMKKMNKGDVLVAHATNPDIVSAMKLASAIVTDMGGITCHAAIVSRELKIPCVIGTKVATHVLKDGQAVEVDATHGRVTKIG